MLLERCMTHISAVIFDVGETIVDETREYGTWADWLGLPHHTFAAVFGAVIARGLDYRETFQVFRPGFDLAIERERRAEAGQPELFGDDDLYPDARPCLAALRQQGVTVGLAGNQTARAERILRSLDLPVDFIGTSDTWQVEKPSADFFARMIEESGHPAAEILYIGDRIDNDIRPAQAACVQTALLHRGPWGHILDDPDTRARCTFELDSLRDLPALVEKHNTVN